MLRGDLDDNPRFIPPEMVALLRHGLPRFAEAFQLAMDHLGDLIEFGYAARPARDQGTIGDLRAWMRASGRVFRAGGLLTTLAGPPEMVDVRLVTPPRMA